MEPESEVANPNLEDLPGQTVARTDSRVARADEEVQQVMGAQSAKAKPPPVLNGTMGSYGSMGSMMMDGETTGPPLVPESQREGASVDTGRAEQGPGVASLRAAAGRVMATMAAKVQGAMPPSVKTGSASSFLGQDDGGSAGTLGSGYVTAGSENLREDHSSRGGQEAAEPGLFSPQQAQRLREMQSEAPLLYAGEENEPRPTSPSPPLPHSTSSGSDQADAIQAEVKRQMQTFMRVQAELQQRVTVLVEENQVLRQVASSSVSAPEGQGSQQGKGGWFSGIRKNLMGFVQQVPVKSASIPLAIPEGWAMPTGSFTSPPPPLASSSPAITSLELANQAGGFQPATPIAPSAGQHQNPYGLVQPSVPLANSGNQGYPKQWQPFTALQGWQRPPGLGSSLSNPIDPKAQGTGAGGPAGATQGVGTGNAAFAQGTGAGSIAGAAQGVGTGSAAFAQGTGAGGIASAAQGVGTGSAEFAQGTGAGSIAGAAQGAGTGSAEFAQGTGAGGIACAEQGAGTGNAGLVPGPSAGGFEGNHRVEPPKNPFEAMMSGIIQLQSVVADLAANKHGSASPSSGSNPEVVRPGVTELVKLPPPTLEGALGFSDWIHAVKPSMSDLSDTSGDCWERVLQEARDWYNNQFVPANPIGRVRLRVPASSIDGEPRWARVRHRMEHLIIQSCPDAVKSELSSARISGVMGILCRLHVVYKPGGVAERAEALRQVQSPRPADSAVDAVLRLRTWKRWMTRLTDLGGASPDAALCVQALESITSNVLRSMPSLSFRINLVRASLHLDTQPTTSKVGEYYEHLLVELEAVSRVSDSQPATAVSAKPEANKNVRQVEAKVQGASDANAGTKDPKGVKGSGVPASADSPKKLCKWFHEGKGCKRGKECRFLHDWNQIPKPDRAERCMACGAKGHRKDVCPNSSAGAVAKRDDGASSAKAAKAEGHAKAKGADPGLKKVLSEAAGVLRDVLSSQSVSPDGNSQVQPDQARGQASATSGGDHSQGRESPIAAAAKIQAQLESLESRLSDQGPRIRAVHAGALSQEEPTALLDSGATHAVLDASSVHRADLIPCTVSLAGDQKQVWHQTPGGSLVAPENKEGGVSQTILPLGCLIEQLGCTVRWSRKSGLQLIHPRLGRLKTSLKSGCPQLGKEQALQLVKELEGARLQELSGRLRRVQAQLKVAGGMQFEEALDAFVTQGSYGTALAFARFMPFLCKVPERVTSRLLVDLQDAVGWEFLKGLPFNRATRKKLHQSHAWLLHLGANKVDPTLRQLCKAQHLELVVLDGSLDGTLDPGVWKALSWAAFTGRVAGILGDAPMRTWNPVKVDETSCIQLRSREHLWGEPSNSEGVQARVDDDTVLGIQPMWLWTIASLARGEGVPFCQTHALQSESRSAPWLEAVVYPFAEWSNGTKFEVPGVHEGVRQTKPFQVCTNLGFSSTGVRSLPGRSRADDVPVDPEWPTAFKSELSLALFGLAAPRQAEEEPTSVKVVEAPEAYLLSDSTRPAGPVSFGPPMPEVQAVDGELPGGSDGVPVPPPAAGEECFDLCVDAEEDAGVSSPSAAGARKGKKAKKGGAAARMTDAERERWRKHIAAHHIPFRKDCLQCVMSGSLGLQHRRVKCPTMYALAFDLAGPFKELGKDDRGGKIQVCACSRSSCS